MEEKSLSIKKILDLTEKHFKKKGIENARLEAEVLLSHLMKKDRLELYMNFDSILSDIEIETFRDYVKKRSERMPVAYITGRKEFYSLTFKVNEDVLIPRPETEILVETALEKIRSRFDKKLKVLDIGTGCGNIAVAIAKNSELVKVDAFDSSKKAIEIAKENARLNKVENKINFFQFDINGDFYELRNKVGKIDVIVSNPPYIPSSIIETLAPEICNYEPLQALDGGQDGLEYISKIINMANGLILNKGYVFIEIGHDQPVEAKKLCDKYFKTDLKADIQGHQRILIGYRE
ncbi:MAG TPA: peptide chain release factor N(5)-glutamine methyltransferase [Firmicutes bacterium]|nr:peptide chain release factor N(5)-glutamine methyltransferase [Bacillota bacterium]